MNQKRPGRVEKAVRSQKQSIGPCLAGAGFLVKTSCSQFKPKNGIETADNADDTDGKRFTTGALEMIPPATAGRHALLIRAIRVIRGFNIGFRV